MKTQRANLEEKAKRALQACLSKIPFLEIEDISREPVRDKIRPDFIAKFRLPEGEKVILVEIKSSGQPRLAREAVNQLVRYRDSLPGAYGVFMAPYISRKAAEICAEENIGYADLAGNCRICLGPIYIELEGKPKPFSEKRDLRSLYSPKAERVLRVLLNSSRKSWKMQDLSDESTVSLGQAANVKKLLLDREWIKNEKTGFVLTKPGQLLEEWASNYSFKRNRIRRFYSLKGIPQIEADLAEICDKKRIRYALTGFSGASRLAPAVRYQKVTAYVEITEEEIDFLPDLKKVPGGANVNLIYPYDEGVFYGAGEFDGVRIASPVQIYLDLQESRARGEEAAEALYEVIKTTW